MILLQTLQLAVVLAACCAVAMLCVRWHDERRRLRRRQALPPPHAPDGTGPAPGPGDRAALPAPPPTPAPEERQPPGRAVPRTDPASDMGPSASPPASPAVGPAPLELRHRRPLEPGAVVPPTLGGVPRAARHPWRLPAEPAQPGLIAEEASLGALEVRAASMIGPDHRCAEPARPRQDSYRLGRDRFGRYLLIAVADGMSDSLRSDLGATVATASAVTELRRWLDHRCLAELHAVDLFREVARNMTAASKQRGLVPDDLRSTLLAAAVATEPGPDGRHQTWIGCLADTSAWERADTGWRQVAGTTKALDSFDRNVLDTFLPFHYEQAREIAFQLVPGDVLALVTDGVSDAFDQVAGAQEWFAARWASPPPLASFLLDVGYEARGQLDDRTAVVIWCRGSRRPR